MLLPFPWGELRTFATFTTGAASHFFWQSYQPLIRNFWTSKMSKDPTSASWVYQFIHVCCCKFSEVSLFYTLCFQIVFLTSGCTGDMSLSLNYVSIFHVYLLIWGLTNLTKRETRILDKHLNTTMLHPLAFLLLVAFSSASPVTKVKNSLQFIFTLTHILMYPAI